MGATAEKDRETSFCDACDIRVPSKESASWDPLVLNPKVTFKILTHTTHGSATHAVHIYDVVVLKTMQDIKALNDSPGKKGSFLHRIPAWKEFFFNPTKRRDSLKRYQRYIIVRRVRNMGCAANVGMLKMSHAL